jgi:hypothetical protein
MKIEQLKLYFKYKHIEKPKKELIYVGIDINNRYWFLFKSDNYKISFSDLKRLGLNPDKIIKNLNLETGFDVYGDKYIKGYWWCFYYTKDYIELSFKQHLKDKLKNIINR